MSVFLVKLCVLRNFAPNTEVLIPLKIWIKADLIIFIEMSAFKCAHWCAKNIGWFSHNFPMKYAHSH